MGRTKDKQALNTLRSMAEEHDWEEIRTDKLFDEISCGSDIAALMDVCIGKVKDEDTVIAYEQNATLQALQNQINPHFLYNTLECIRGQAYIDGNKEVAVMLETLGNFFRYSISRKENIVTLSDEIVNLQGYMKIMNYRFSDRYELQIDFMEDEYMLRECYVPKLILQPVVENCILHGFDDKPKGTVTVTVDCADDMLMLTVADDGVGMDEKTLQKLNEKIKGSISPNEIKTGRGHGIGMTNVNKRIGILFGKEYGIHLYSTKGMGTEVEFTLPLILRREGKEP
jgi:two-component system sensor histidine kinase YesM